jgi:hypothetical protein
MCKRSASSLVLSFLVVTIALNAKAGFTIHEIDAFPPFSSTADITNFFSKECLSSHVLELKLHNRNNFIVAAYPYSGVDTIDVFHFVKWGARWEIKMVFFYLRPKQRKLSVKETKTKILLHAAKEELLSITVDRTLNSIER